jgi:hypothetical protein
MASDQFIPPAPPIGVIESLTSGFEMVAGKLPLLLIPLLIDLFLWVGPRVSYRQLAELAVQQMFQPLQDSVGADQRSQVQDTIKLIQEWGKTDHYLPLFGVPSILGDRDASKLPFSFIPPVLTVTKPLAWVGVYAAAFVIGFLIWGVYIGAIAGIVKEGRVTLGHLSRTLLGALPQLLIFQVVLSVLMIVIILVLTMGLIALPMLLMGPAAADPVVNVIVTIVLLLASVFVIIVGVFLSFTVHGMLLNNRNVFAAVWDSIRVVQWNVTSTFGLLLLIMIINAAMRSIWLLADPGSWVSLAAISGNAFISTGLLAATFIFFKDRHRYWKALREEILAELERRRAQQNSS